MRKRTPQEKKALSYARDRRNCYGANDKSSRRSIRMNKVRRMRAHRRNVNQILQSETPGIDAKGSELLDSKVRGERRRKWLKSPDEPLGEVVKWQLERRPLRHGAKSRRREDMERQRIRRREVREAIEAAGKLNKDA